LPTWIKLPKCTLEFWNENTFWANGEVLGKFTAVDDSYKSCGFRSIAQILVELDPRNGLYESMDLQYGDKKLTQILDYVNMPFCCVRCHIVGHVVKDCGFKFHENDPKAGTEASKMLVSSNNNS
jgi:hypothetical protein